MAVEESLLEFLVPTSKAERLLGVRPRTLEKQMQRRVCPITPYKLRIGKKTFYRWDIRELEALVSREENK